MARCTGYGHVIYNGFLFWNCLWNRVEKVNIKASAEETFDILLYYSGTSVAMVQTMGFGVYTQYSHCVPVFSILCNRVGLGVVFITVYNGYSVPPLLGISLHCTRIVEYSTYITLAENSSGNSQNGAGFLFGVDNWGFLCYNRNKFHCVKDAVNCFSQEIVAEIVWEKMWIILKKPVDLDRILYYNIHIV